MAKKFLFSTLLGIFTLTLAIASGLPNTPNAKFCAAEVCEAPPPDSLRATSIGGTYVSLEWVPAWPGATHVLTVSELDSSGGWVPVIIFNNVSGSTLTVDSLSSGKQYRFRMATKCPNGDPGQFTGPVEINTIIVELTLGGRTPKNPSEIGCTGIAYQNHPWLGFRVTGPGASNIFEVVVNEESDSPLAYIRRVFTVNSIVAVAPDGSFPTPAFPLIGNVPVPFKIERVNTEESIGAIDIVKHSTNPPTIDICKNVQVLPWKPEYTLTILTAKEVVVIPGGGGGGTGTGQGFGTDPLGTYFKIQNPFLENIQVFVPDENELEGGVTLRLFDTNGKIIKTQQFETGDTGLILPVPGLPPGMYILQIQTMHETQSHMVFKF
jgi:hypothetical protein